MKFQMALASGVFLLATVAAPGAQTLALGAGDVTLEAREDGYHLFVRARAGIGSVMLTESFELEDHSQATYALRAPSFNTINGNEKRLLDGKPLPAGHFSLIDSSPEPHAGWPEGAYRILVPPVVVYGYPWTRSGRQDLTGLSSKADQTFWFSLRAFTKPFGDYTGAYRDNAFEIRSVLMAAQEAPAPAVDGLFRPGLKESFEGLSDRTLSAKDPEDLLRQLRELLSGLSGDSLDLVLVVDTTKSMADEMDAVKRGLLAPVRDTASRFRTMRVGFVFYRDYMEEYLNRSVAFQSDWDALQAELNKAQAIGGGDVPEAVHEALYAAATTFLWSAEKRLVILVGDAPDHDLPRGRITKEMTESVLKDKDVSVISIMMPYQGLAD